MRKLLLLLGVSMFCIIQTALAQTKEVTGKVTDDKGVPVAGATVQEKGTRKATTTDAEGTFKITVKDGALLIISYVGFDKKEIATGDNANLNVSLKANNSALNEVVVTALGIKKEKKALGYAVATVDKKALELRPDGDVVRLLNGKAPGVDILNASGMSGSGTNIQIRGVSTITGSSTPLFIVDGVPFDASTTSQAGFQYGNATSSRFLDLDPNNIENISVLKGLSATTLYGELGRNGVVVVTTKNGSSRKVNKKTEITATQSYFSNTVANLPEYQQTYGGGFDQSLGLAFFSNWGAKFANPPIKVAHPYDRAALFSAFPEFNQTPGANNDLIYEYKPYNSVEQFFRQGAVKTTSINIASGTFNANYTYLDDIGFTPGNRLVKNTFGIGGNAKLANNFTAVASINYAVTDLTAPPTGTSFGSNPTASSVFGNLIYTPIAVDLIGLPWENPLDKSSVYYRGSNDIQNPIWTVNNSFTGQKVNRIFGSILLRYDIAKNLNVSYRVGLDNYTDYNFLSQNKGGVVGGEIYQLGLHRTVNGSNTIWNHDFLLDWNKDISSDLNLSVNAGVNSQERLYQQNGQRSSQQLVYGLFDHDNFVAHDNFSEDGRSLDFISETQSIGAFAQGTLGYKEYAYLTLGGRNSWTSNLEKNNRSLFYPSASISFIPTSAFAFLQSSKAINYLKLRLGYATSANFGFPYGTRPNLTISTNVFQDRVGTIINTNAIGNRLGNLNLKPELMGESEAGIEGKFMNNRLSLDLTFYQRISSDQILDRNLDPASGYTVTYINAGNVRNRGIEMALGYTVVRSKDWRWQLDANYTQNRSRVYGLPDYVKQVVIDGFTNEGLFAVNGQPLGIIKGSQIERYSKEGGPKEALGKRVVDGNGNYLASTEIGILGDPTPDFKLTGISTLGYKGFSFRMQWDYTQGGDMLAYTPGTVVGRGLSKDTDFDRLQGFILPGVKQDGTPNDIQLSASQAYFNNLSGFFGGADLITFDATVIRLREASLSYAIPESLLNKTPFGGISLTISGQNLWYNAPNFPKYVNFDPETSSLGVSNVRGLEYLSGPTSRRIGASLRITF